MDSVLGLVRHAGNDSLFRTIEMSLLATASGQPLHLHAEGVRGTGKTTIMRAVRRTLPRIRRIKDCLYNCDPSYPHCPRHRSLSAAEIAALGEEWVPMPFLEISHSARVGTVVGSIDLGRLVSPTHPEAAILPGVIPQAHRGIIFVDEINRLAETAPELADILLDVMGTKPGRVQIEETGLPTVELPVQVSVWAASNPDEDPGPLEDIRRQLSDRFDFVVYTDRPGDAAVVEQILAAATDADWRRPLSALDVTKLECFRTKLASRMAGLSQVQVPKPLRQQIAEIYSRFNVESLRAVQAIHLGMRLAASLNQREEAGLEELIRIAPLALRHRVDAETFKKVTAHLASLKEKPEAEPAPAVSLKQRLSNVSFGGAASEPAPTQVQTDSSKEKAADSTGSAPQTREAARSGSWLQSTLSSLRHLRLNQAPDTENQNRSDSRPRAVNPYNQHLLANRALRQPTPEKGSGPSASGTDSAARQSHKSRSPDAPSALQLADPLKMPGVAPPHPARAIEELESYELIRSEEELGRQ